MSARPPRTRPGRPAPARPAPPPGEGQRPRGRPPRRPERARGPGVGQQQAAAEQSTHSPWPQSPLSPCICGPFVWGREARDPCARVAPGGSLSLLHAYRSSSPAQPRTHPAPSPHPSRTPARTPASTGVPHTQEGGPLHFGGAEPGLLCLGAATRGRESPRLEPRRRTKSAEVCGAQLPPVPAGGTGDPLSPHAEGGRRGESAWGSGGMKGESAKMGKRLAPPLPPDPVAEQHTGQTCRVLVNSANLGAGTRHTQWARSPEAAGETRSIGGVESTLVCFSYHIANIAFILGP